MTDRKLIRPSLRDYKRQRHTEKSADSNAPVSRKTSVLLSATRRKQSPPEQTNAENYYYLKQMGAKTPVVVYLIDGEEIHGWIEWYDKNCIKVHRHTEANLLIYKHSIKYIVKERDL